MVLTPATLVEAGRPAPFVPWGAGGSPAVGFAAGGVGVGAGAAAPEPVLPEFGAVVGVRKETGTRA